MTFNPRVVITTIRRSRSNRKRYTAWLQARQDEYSRLCNGSVR